MPWPLGDLLAALEIFERVAAVGPLSAFLLLVAALLFAVVFGGGTLLVLGAISNTVFGWP
ncbi:MAG: hypothetical protein ABEJ60_07475 [Halodesulfurarchaeum sp.]